MPKRFSGEVRLTISRGHNHDFFDIKVKAPGCAACSGGTILENGYEQLHGEEEAFDEAAIQYLKYLEEHKPTLVAKAAKISKKGDTFHVGRSKAERWPGGISSTLTKKGRNK